MFTFGRWQKYWGVVTSQEQASVNLNVGSIYSVAYPGLPVPCDVGTKFVLDPFPITGMTNEPGCFSKPSHPFQIKMVTPLGDSASCVTIVNHAWRSGMKIAKMTQCVDGPYQSILETHQEQFFTLETKGCD